MKPENQHNHQNDDGLILPRPVQNASITSDGRSGFPPLGTTLPSYAPSMSSMPPMYGQSGLNFNRQPAAPATDTPVKKKADWKKRFKRLFIGLVIIGVLAGGYIGTKLLMNASKSLGGNLLGLLQTQKLQGEDTGHVNILLAGNSADDAGHSGGELTDSIMIVSIDTVNNRAALLSIPRDLWVDVPGSGYSKINSAYVFGKADKFDESGYPPGGMGALEKVVETNFGIDINYYALVNYTALRDAVNAVGGIDVVIKSSDPRGLYDPNRDWTKSTRSPLVRLANGPQSLDGQTALNLARARGSAYGAYGYGQGDFTRSENQRLMVAALKEKAVSAGVVSNPVKIGNLLDSFGNNVVTDFQTDEVRRLLDILKKIPGSNIKSASLNDADGENLLTSYRTFNGQSALIPAAGVDDYSDISAFLEKLMTPPAPSNSSNSSPSPNSP